MAGQAIGAPGDVTVSQVEDISPGNLSSFSSDLVNMDGTLLFTADDGTSGKELWKSTAPYTAATTEMIEDIGPGDGVFGSLRKVGSRLFFAADDGSTGVDLWKSEAPYTAATTDLLKNIDGGGGDSFPGGLGAVVGGTFVFRADIGGDDRLWKSDGTPGGTVEVVDVRPGGFANMQEFVAAGNAVYFSANDGVVGQELWKIAGPDFDAASTDIVENEEPDGGASKDFSPEDLINVNGTVFFRGNPEADPGELYKSNGTTVDLVENINPGGAAISGNLSAAAVGNTLFFPANDGTNGTELWKSAGPDFNMASTEIVANLGTAGASSDPQGLAGFGDTLLFMRATDPALGSELWKSTPPYDGTTTENVVDLNPGMDDGSAFDLTESGGSVFFTGYSPTAGYELHRTRPPFTATTTSGALADINPGAIEDPGLQDGSDPGNLTDVNGTLFFTARRLDDDNDPSQDEELWKATIEGSVGGAPPAGATPTGSTGQRAAALKKCKKKKSKKKRKKCRKRAKKLPV